MLTINNLKGRLSRKNYLWTLGMIFVVWLTLTIVGLEIPHEMSSLTIVVLSTILACVLLLFASTQRLKDVNKKYFWSILLFVPLIQILFLFYLTISKGDVNTNSFGEKDLRVLPAYTRYITAGFLLLYLIWLVIGAL